MSTPRARRSTRRPGWSAGSSATTSLLSERGERPSTTRPTSRPLRTASRVCSRASGRPARRARSFALPLDPPETIPGPGADVPASDPLPTLASLGLDDPPLDARACRPARRRSGRDRARPGVGVGRRRARPLQGDAQRAARPGYSSKYSPWLAHGCLSPRRVYADVRAYETERGANSSTYWLIFELIWRDFFHFLALHEGDRLFYRGGILGRDYRWSEDIAAFDRWRRERRVCPSSTPTNASSCTPASCPTAGARTRPALPVEVPQDRLALGRGVVRALPGGLRPVLELGQLAIRERRGQRPARPRV